MTRTRKVISKISLKEVLTNNLRKNNFGLPPWNFGLPPLGWPISIFMFSVGALGVVQMEVWTHILKCVILVSVWKQTVLLAIKILPSHSHQCCNSYSFHPKCSMCFMSLPCPKYATLSHLWLVFITTVSFQIRSYEIVKVGTQIHGENIWLLRILGASSSTTGWCISFCVPILRMMVL